ncbi:FAD-dependent oxidoreductase [Rhodohalobacter sp.]|uniref:FAD-dependent oxidoreductase n=1 Tax=Rhodohalobacter sp. TaxID=1974210 RepID=UPI002ACE94E9|nr:FAD-dependent oxidoreductase [Rhodohalobacter sp.]MDZ7756332.1 FAD-dependent oxidoreductase [Rhodohalobacter sp.]
MEQQPSYRIEGGTSVLIRTLAGHLQNEDLFLDEPVSKITANNSKLIIEGINNKFEAGKVISTLPPRLLASRIQIEPDLPKSVKDLLSVTHTWMGESMKFGLTFDDPFWLEENSSGTVFSNVGLVTEMYDHSMRDGSQHAVKGFLNSTYFSVSKEERLKMVLKQLRKYLWECDR